MGQEPASTLLQPRQTGRTPSYKAGGLRDFFLYRDLGVAAATNGKVVAHLVRAALPPTDGTGWHKHDADFQIVIMMKGWAKFMYEDKVTLVEAGDVVHQRPGMVHYLFDYSPDMEDLEIVVASPISARSRRRATPPTRCRPSRRGNNSLGHDGLRRGWTEPLDQSPLRAPGMACHRDAECRGTTPWAAARYRVVASCPTACRSVSCR